MSDEFRPLLLKLMADHKARHKTSIVEEVCGLAGLSMEERLEKIPSGISRAANRIGWARSSYVKSGILERVGRAVYRMTPLGSEMAEKWKNFNKIKESDLVGLPMWDSYLANLYERKNHHIDGISSSPALETFAGNHENPEDKIRSAIREIEDETAVELLNRSRSNSPAFFEKAVLNLLLAMGYGGKENLYAHVGKSHDGGIDGVVKQDPLGIQNIYIQAKRYADGNSIGSKEIQSFAGALQGNGVERGVFIATSSFTKQAREYAQKLLGRVILIDGQYLATLMIRYKVGIQTKQAFEIIELDEDFFIE
ncbi:restriction endonuclease [Neisseria musculi]|uniref:Restriction endonuclease family protein n=1 Tax=Neisseria musculi TaxID=1815583 RepID=A0A7H1MDG0_9NEIS|nr:restriction endonuclease [Neisseria musculi]QNT59675.1 restriction endonuclease family protein [Neisseria musculi]